MDSIWFQKLRLGPNHEADYIHLPGNVYYKEFLQQMNNTELKDKSIDITQFRDCVDYGNDNNEWFDKDNSFEFRWMF